MIHKKKHSIFISILLSIIILTSNLNGVAQDSDSAHNKKEDKKKLSFKDPVDGAFDISSFILEHNGFMAVPFIITEPAVGYGGGAAFLFFHKQKKKYDVKVPPNITGAAGLGTQNKTWLIGVFHFHVWGPDKIRYLSGLGKTTIHIKYYGNNNDYLSENPLKLKLDAWAFVQRVQVRIAKTDLFLGGSYVLFTTDNSFDELPDNPLLDKIIQKLEGRSTLSMLQPIANWDSRNNIFTPTKGLNTGLIFSYNATWLGADENYYELNPYFLGYQPISKRVFSGWRFEGNFMMGDPPLYALPFVQLRGVPAMRYQSNNTMLVETEWRFNVYGRWSLNTFGGTGKAFPSFDEFGSSQWVYNYGIGFRYELARALGLNAGIDFAFSNNKEFAFYIIFGSAWNK